MASATRTSNAAAVGEFLRAHNGPWANGPVDIDLYRTGYLSTMFRCRSRDAAYLVNVKHHDPGGKRAAREFEVLSVLDGSIAPRAHALDLSKRWLDDPVLVTDLVVPNPVPRWDNENLDSLAQLMARIHADARLLNLAADGAAATEFSVRREVAEESRDVPSFRPSPLKDELTGALEDLEPSLDSWEEFFQGGPTAYVHSDLPHHHLFQSPQGWKTIHWEWSRCSHPTRELARALWDLEMETPSEEHFLERYAAHSGAPVNRSALRVQRVLQYVYNAIHVAFWLDRAAPATHPDWEKAARMAKVVRLWIRMETGDQAWQNRASA